MDLDGKCLEKIVSHLSLYDRIRVSRVCRQWYKSIKSSLNSVRRLMILPLDENGFPEAVLANAEKGQVLKLLPAKNDHCLVTNIDSILGWLPNLISIRMVSPFDVPETGLIVKAIIYRYPDLIDFHLETRKELDSTSLLNLITNLTGLMQLTLANCGKFTERSLAFVLTSCRKLKCLVIVNNLHLTGKAFKRSNGQLECLKLIGCPNITSKAIHSLSRFGVNLTHLEFGGYASSENERLASQAKELKINNMYAYSVDLEPIFRRFNRLKTLRLSNVQPLRDRSFISLMESTPEMRIFEMDDNTYITDSSMEKINEFWSELEVLKLSYLPHVTRQSILATGKLKFLLVLYMMYLEGITDFEILEFFHLAPKCLEKLQLLYDQHESKVLSDDTMVNMGTAIFAGRQVRIHRNVDNLTGSTRNFIIMRGF